MQVFDERLDRIFYPIVPWTTIQTKLGVVDIVPDYTFPPAKGKEFSTIYKLE